MLAEEEEERQHRTRLAQGPCRKSAVRLTRDFPTEQFFAVILPLAFPLLLPMIASWIKEYQRYKRLTGPARDDPKQQQKQEQQQPTPAAPSSAKAKTE